MQNFCESTLPKIYVKSVTLRRLRESFKNHLMMDKKLYSSRLCAEGGGAEGQSLASYFAIQRDNNNSYYN